MQMRSEGYRETALQLALECLAKSGSLHLQVTGTSMLPAIRPGSLVWIRSLPPSEVHPGDIVLARASGGLRLHRLMEIQGCGADAVWTTRGDNNEDLDPPLDPARVLGVLGAVRQPGRVSWFRRVLGAALRRVRPA